MYLNVSIYVKISLYNETWFYVSFVVFSVQIFSKYPTMQFEPVMRTEHNIMHSSIAHETNIVCGTKLFAVICILS